MMCTVFLHATAYMLSGSMRSICYHQFVHLSVTWISHRLHGWISQTQLKLGLCDFLHAVAATL